jgi:hypothetical protein
VRPSVESARARLAVFTALLCAVFVGTTVLVAATFTDPYERAEAPTIPASESREPSAVDLTRQWAAYGRAATCADWSGADGMQAVGLGSGKVAWFFADTLLGPVDSSDPNAQASKPLINNSLVIESKTAGKVTRKTVTGGGACPWDRLPGAKAQALVKPEQRGQWYWGGDGIRVGDSVLKFFNRYRGGGPRYLPMGTALTTFPVGELTKSTPAKVIRPRVKELRRFVPNVGGSPLMWGSAVYEVPAGEPVPARPRRRTTEAMVYVYGWHVRDVNDQRKRMYLARVPKRRLTDFRAWSFYAGAGRWAPTQAGARPVQPPGRDFAVSTIWSVTKINGRHWLVQHEPGLDDPDIVAYPAPTPWGPFDPGQRMVLYRAGGIGRTAANGFRIIYEARLIPVLSTARTLVIGYNLNTTAVSTGCRSLNSYTDAIYRPQFLTVPAADFPWAGPARTRPRVTPGWEGPPPGADIVNRHPGQWFDAWNYPVGQCPPLPRIPAVRALPRPDGSVSLGWQPLGLDVAYRVYHRESGGKPYRVRTLFGTTATLRGYARGKTYEWRVVPINVKGGEGPATTAAVRIP